MNRDRMRSLSDVPLPPPPRAEGAQARSDVAPRPSQTKSTIPPDQKSPDIETVDEEIPFPQGAFSPDEAIDDQIADLERWAAANERRERNESIRFWILKGTACLAAVFAAIAGPLGYVRVSTVLAGVAALFIAIDSAWPGSSLRNPYRRAVYDLRALQNTIKLRWDKVRLAYPNPTGARRVANALALLDAIQTKREDIGRYLGSAEASPGMARSSDPRKTAT
jgi:hypothetical protein